VTKCEKRLTEKRLPTTKDFRRDDEKETPDVVFLIHETKRSLLNDVLVRTPTAMIK